MKRKSCLCLIVAVMLLASGCGKEKAEVLSTVNTSTVESVTDSSRMEESAADVSAAELSASVGTAVDETGFYPETTGLTELSLGINDVACTIKVPLNYIMAGASYMEGDTEKNVEKLGATVTVEEAFSEGSITDTTVLNFFGITSLDAIPTRLNCAVYECETFGTLEDAKKFYTEGYEIGTQSKPAWVYASRENMANPDADIAMYIQVSDTEILNILYQGPVFAEVGEKEMAQRVYDMVTIK